MLLLDKSIAFIRQKACFLTIKHMVLSAGNHENRPVLSNRFTFTCYLLPMTYYRIAAGASRLLSDDDKNIRRNLTIGVLELRVVNSFWSLHTFRSQREFIRYAGFKFPPSTVGYRAKTPSAPLCPFDSAAFVVSGERLLHHCQKKEAAPVRRSLLIIK